MDDEEQLFKQFAQDYKQMVIRHPGIDLQMPALEAWALACTVQLACRHPEFVGPTRQIAERAARKLFDELAATPALAEVARRGWDPAFDDVEDEATNEGDDDEVMPVYDDVERHGPEWYEDDNDEEGESE